MSVLELIKTFEKVSGIRVPIKISNRRKGDYGIVIADNSLAKSLLKWTPKRSLEDMCQDGWNWKKNNLQGF